MNTFATARTILVVPMLVTKVVRTTRVRDTRGGACFTAVEIFGMGAMQTAPEHDVQQQDG